MKRMVSLVWNGLVLGLQRPSMVSWFGSFSSLPFLFAPYFVVIDDHYVCERTMSS